MNIIEVRSSVSFIILLSVRWDNFNKERLMAFRLESQLVVMFISVVLRSVGVVQLVAKTSI